MPALRAENVLIEGGVRITPVRARWAFAAPAVPAAQASQAERDLFAAMPDADRVLVVRTDVAGDFSTYRLSIVPTPKDTALTEDFDPELSAVDFSFKVECPNDFDCLPLRPAPAGEQSPPGIDYLAKDYASFRQLLLDRLALLLPEWRETHVPDLGIALVELLAYVADHLSYYQDAVATEAYLGTSRPASSTTSCTMGSTPAPGSASRWRRAAWWMGSSPYRRGACS